MSLAVIGWAVVHSLWQCTFIAGLTAMILGLLRDPRARARYRIAGAALALMTLTLLATAFSGQTALGESVRFQVIYAIDPLAGAGFPAIINAAAVIVPAAGGLWLAGVGLGLLRIGLEWRRVRALRHGDLHDAGDHVRAVVAGLRARMGVRAGVDVSCSTRVTVPMLVGWRRPLILLPESTTAALSASQLRAVLAHELAHVRRNDYLANLIQIGVDILLFHHPAARWVSRRIRTEREYCCDDVALRIEDDTAVYARALAALEDARTGYRLVVAAASGTLLDRIQRIAGHPRPMLTPARGAVALVLTILLAGVILAITMIVPPSLPAGAQLRRRGPPPNGVVIPGPERKLPRSPVR